MLCGFKNPFFNLFFGKSHVFRAEGNILSNSFFKKLVLGILENKADFKTESSDILGVCPKVFSADKNLAGGRLNKSVKVLNKGGFSGTGVADKSDEGALFDFDIDIIYCAVLIGSSFGIDVAQIFGFNDGFSHSEHRLSKVLQEQKRILLR